MTERPTTGGTDLRYPRWAQALYVVVPAVAGAVFGVYALRDELSIAVDDQRVHLVRGAADRRLDRGAVAAVFVDGKELVLLGPDTNELAREKTDRSAAALADAFTRLER